MPKGTTHAVKINGVKTSVSLESPFWEHLKKICEARQNKSMDEMLSQLDIERPDGVNFCSFLRVYVLRYLEGKLNEVEVLSPAPQMA